jgi:hypothetical protein
MSSFNIHDDQFPAAKAIEHMIVDALLAAEPHLHIAEQVFKPEKFVYLTEDIMSTIERSTDDVSVHFHTSSCSGN